MTTRFLTWIGVIATLLYVALVAYLVLGKLGTVKNLPLNELGDFLAGVFGPVVVLWLILGYFQQGIELRQNTEALRLQAEELRRSVEHQGDLVSVAREQAKTDKDALESQREMREREFRPNFVVSGDGIGGARYGDDTIDLSFHAFNRGAKALLVVAKFDVEMQFVKPERTEICDSDEHLKIAFRFADGSIRNCKLTLKFNDLLGISHQKDFHLIVDPSGKGPGLIVVAG